MNKINIIWKEHLNLDEIFYKLYKKFGYVELKVENKKGKIIKIGDKNIIDFTKEYFNYYK